MPAARLISWFADIGLGDRPEVGGKGGSLGELQRAGVVVPPGFVIKTSAFEQFINMLEQKAPLRARVERLSDPNLAEAAACCAELRARVEAEPLPSDVQAEISTAYAMLCSGAGDLAVAVRSSATTEDAADASFA